MIKGLRTKKDFETMFPLHELDGIGDRWLTRWRSSQALRYIKYLDLLARYLIPSSKKRYLDIGCAQSTFIVKINDRFPNFSLVGTDISDNVIEWNKKQYPENEYYQSSLPQVDFLPNSFDVVSALEVIYYLEPILQIEAFKNIAKVLCPKGLFLLSGVLDGGKQYWDDAWICNNISCFFNIIAVEYHYAHLYSNIERPLLSLSRRLQNIITKKGHKNSDKYTRMSTFGNLRYSLYNYCQHNEVIKKLLSLNLKVLHWVLSWNWLPVICFQMNKLVYPEKGKSRIIILARKKD